MRAFVLILPALCLLLAACGSGSDDSARADSKSESKSKSDGDGYDPCGILSEKLIRSHFDIGDAELASRSSVQSRYSTCIVSWPAPDHEALEEAYKQAIIEYTQAKGRGEDVEMPASPATHREVTVTVPNKRFDSPEQAQSALDTALDIMKNGLKTRPKTEEQRAKVIIEPVDGLGDKAAWSVRGNQISVANGRGLFHLAVKVYDDPDENRDKAIELAKLFLKDVR